MVHQLYIKNFGGITEGTVDIKDFSVLVGRQGTGKSVFIKLLHFFTSSVNQNLIAIPSFRVKDFDIKSYDKALSTVQDRFTRIFPVHSWPEHPFEIKYTNGDLYIYIISTQKGGRNDIRIEVSSFVRDAYLNAIEKLSELKADSELASQEFAFRSRGRNLVRHSLLVEINQKSYFKFGGYAFYIPASRAFYSMFSANAISFLSSNYVPSKPSTFDATFLDFADTFEEILEDFGDDGAPDIGSIGKSNLLLGADIAFDDEDAFLKHFDGRIVSIKNSSSGQQELMPLLVMLEFISNLPLNTQANSLLFIEEPEAHIFPDSQYEVIQLIASQYQMHFPRLSIMVTTHSPYVLSAFNNLLAASKLKSSSRPVRKKRLAKLVKNAINPSYFSALKFDSGQITELLHRKHGIIDTSYLDSISNIISEDFDAILDQIN